MKKQFFSLPFALLLSVAVVKGQSISGQAYHDPFRPQLHFTPKEKWMNDPNGLVYFNNAYHLFFQHYPDSTVWGPMHWGHAVSKDLVHWQQLPIALYPDTLGYIYSGSIVVDAKNTTGFGKDGQVPLVAIFTHSNPVLRKAGANNYQSQSIAYSLDGGTNWVKYEGNPVLKNPGIKDFRDPKVSWYEAGKKWVMILATKDRVSFYSSPDLKNWAKESEFGQQLGAHGGVWECPDLISFNTGGKTSWVLLSSINPGGPNGGSATQYFVGDFDGKTFTPYDTATRWVDYGTDNYAGVTWSNTGNRKLFIGWMSNWKYANLVPTKLWRSAMTLPRELQLTKVKNQYLLASRPVKELDKYNINQLSQADVLIKDEYTVKNKPGTTNPYQLKISMAALKDVDIVLSNENGEEVTLGFKALENQFFIDRTTTGASSFEKGFARIMTAPRLSVKSQSDITLFVDAASVEMFCDDGLSVMTCIFFPKTICNTIKIRASGVLKIKQLNYSEFNSIWR